MPRVLLLDHFDSFTWNVLHGLAQAGAQVEVRRCDGVDAEAVLAAGADLLVLSPGPGRPEDARVALEVLARLARPGAPRLPVLGICLGMQVLAHASGGRVDRAPEPVHGKVSAIRHAGQGLFQGLPSPMPVGRYHSLCVRELPPDLEATAWTEDGVLMGLRHRERPLAGVQFHPDSFLTPHGTEILRNALLGRL